MSSDMISRRSRSAFENVLADYTLREIRTLYEDEGFKANTDLAFEGIGERRTLVRQFHGAIDFRKHEAVSRILRVFHCVHTAIPDQAPHDGVKRRLSELLSQDGVDLSGVWALAADEGRLGPLSEIATRMGAETFARQIAILTAICETHPRLAIGTAKEMIETVCRTILAERGVDAPRKWDVPELLKATLQTLSLVPDDIPEHRLGAESIRKAMRSLTTTVLSLAELRNVYGSGHGPDGRAKGLGPRHAHLAVDAAATVANFLFRTHDDAPMREPLP